MRIQAEVSLYPLRQPNLSQPITRFLQSLSERGLDVEFGQMSSRIRGDCGTVFAAMAEGLERACEETQTVLVVKATNIGAGGS